MAAFRLPFGERKPDPADATMLSVPAAEAVDDSTEVLRAGPYVLDEQLAEGGESLVWLATHERDGTPAVVKVQRPGVLPERLRREVAVLYALQEVRTPHVVGLLAAGVDGALGPHPGTLHYREGQSALYCALEVLPCRSAGNLLNGVLQRDQPRPLRRREALEVCDALRGALRVMHLDFGMIHNDLKPENVVAWRDGRDGRLQVRLFDFGHAALLMPHPRTGRPCVLPGAGTRYVYDYGTYAFMAPERWHGQDAFVPHGAPSGRTTDTGGDLARGRRPGRSVVVRGDGVRAAHRPAPGAPGRQRAGAVPAPDPRGAVPYGAARRPPAGGRQGRLAAGPGPRPGRPLSGLALGQRAGFPLP